MIPKAQQHFKYPHSPVIRASYVDDSYIVRVSTHLSKKFKSNQWWWEGKNLYIRFKSPEEYQEIKRILLFLSHDIRIPYPVIKKRVAKVMFTKDELNKLTLGK
jgi:hypothetical protein